MNTYIPVCNKGRNLIKKYILLSHKRTVRPVDALLLPTASPKLLATDEPLIVVFLLKCKPIEITILGFVGLSHLKLVFQLFPNIAYSYFSLKYEGKRTTGFWSIHRVPPEKQCFFLEFTTNANKGESCREGAPVWAKNLAWWLRAAAIIRCAIYRRTNIQKKSTWWQF